MTSRAYRFALDPTPTQARDLSRHGGAARVAYNWGLSIAKAALAQREAERSYGIGEDGLTPYFGWSRFALRKAWNQVKGEVAPWWAECSKEAYGTGLDQLARALNNWSDSRKGKRAGRPVGFPRFKSKRRATPSVKFTTGAIRVESDRMHVTLPRLGRIKTHESTRKLERKLAAGTARILSATVRFEQERWFVSFTVKVDQVERTPRRTDAVVGIDLGLKSLAVLSDGTTVDNPRHFETAKRELARASRKVSRRVGPDRRTGQQASNRWLRANAQRNKAHHRVVNQRRDGLHKLTTMLTRECGVIVVEDLNVAGMARNRRLSPDIHDAGFGELRRQLAYKTQWNGGHLVVADRWFPSSKTCSGCGAVKPKLPLSQRVFTCEYCGLTIDRDFNAALNLRQLVDRAVAGSGPETLNGRGADQKTRPSLAGGCEASTPHPAKAGARRGPAPGNGCVLAIP